MVAISGLAGALLGVPLGVFLRLTDCGGVLENRVVNAVTSAIMNAVQGDGNSLSKVFKVSHE